MWAAESRSKSREGGSWYNMEQGGCMQSRSQGETGIIYNMAVCFDARMWSSRYICNSSRPYAPATRAIHGQTGVNMSR